jgi:hypothetical protein
MPQVSSFDERKKWQIGSLALIKYYPSCILRTQPRGRIAITEKTLSTIACPFASGNNGESHRKELDNSLARSII